MTYTIEQIEELTGIKAHILRYWEEVIPSWNPQKDERGKRIYSENDITLIFRLKYLINQKKFTVEDAGQHIFDEAQNMHNKSGIINVIHECRTELGNAFLQIKECDKQISKSARNN